MQSKTLKYLGKCVLSQNNIILCELWHPPEQNHLHSLNALDVALCSLHSLVAYTRSYEWAILDASQFHIIPLFAF